MDRVGEVELEDQPYPDLLCVGGSRACVHFPDLPTQGWGFEISGSSPVPSPNPSSERPHLEFIGGPSWWYNALPCVQDTVTGKEVFQLFGKFAKPDCVQWDGQYLVAGY